MAEKLTHEEIKKALECCTQQHKCNECPYLMEHHLLCNQHLHKDTLDLINCQQAEIEKRESDFKSMQECARYFENKYEAIKEFVEKLKEDFKSNNYIVSFDRIDNIVKEMGGEDE